MGRGMGRLLRMRRLWRVRGVRIVLRVPVRLPVRLRHAAIVRLLRGRGILTVRRVLLRLRHRRLRRHRQLARVPH